MSAHPITEATERHAPDRRAVGASLAVVVVVQLFCAYGFWHHLDLHPAHECAHVQEGKEMLAGRVDIVQVLTWSGLHSAFYALLLVV